MWSQSTVKSFQDSLKVNMEYRSPHMSTIVLNIKGPSKSNSEKLCVSQRDLKIKFICCQQPWVLFVSYSAYFPRPQLLFIFWVCMDMSMCTNMCTCVWVCGYVCMESTLGFPLILRHLPVSACPALGFSRVYHHTALHIDTGNRTQVFMLARTLLTETGPEPRSFAFTLLIFTLSWYCWFLKSKLSLLRLLAQPNASLL